MTSDLSAVLKLQTLDARIAELQREIAALPKHIAEIEKTLDSHIRRLDADRAALAANQKERKKLEGDIQVQEQKISKLRDQMLGAKTNEQYRAFQMEIEFCQKEIRRHEDRILDLMSESEPLDQNVKLAESSLKQEKQSVEEEKKSARERTHLDQQQLGAAQGERGQLRSSLTGELLSAYERIRKRNATVIAEVTEGRCGACNMSIRPQLLQELKVDTGTVRYCESCKRILYYNPPVSFEHDIAAPPPAG
jgi:predicted  nucleic acid-binding Zn-ribbon protein